MEVPRKSSLLKLVFRKASLLALCFPHYLYALNDFPDDAFCNIAIYAHGTTLYSKGDQAADLWQQLELVPEFKSDLRDTVD